MARALIVFLVAFIALGACTQRLVCPAYQSAFIYDKDALRKKFSYFVGDSTPKVLTASKTKFLIAEATTYQQKERSLRTVEMIPVYPIVPDSLKDDYVSIKELDSAANSIIDSTFIVDVSKPADTLKTSEDSIYMVTKDKEVRLLKYDADSMKYNVVEVRLNVDQDNYMWYLRNHLILPDVRIAKMQQGNKDKKEKKGGFFKNLFKRKKKDKVDSTSLQRPTDEEEFDYVDTLETDKPVVEPVQPKKKGFFSFLKRKNKPAKETTQEDAALTEENPKKKKEKKKKDEEQAEEEVIVDEKAPDQEEKDDGF